MQQTMSFLPIFFFQIPFCYPTQLKLLIRSRHHGKKTFNLWEISSNQSWVELKKLSARKSRKLIYALNLCESFLHHRWKLFALPGKIKINRKKIKAGKNAISHTTHSSNSSEGEKKCSVECTSTEEDEKLEEKEFHRRADSSSIKKQ